MTNVIFGNQLIAGGIFLDDDPKPCTHGAYIFAIVISGCLIIILLLVVYSLRQTCHDLQDRLRRPVMVPMPIVPTVAAPPALMTGPSYPPMVITTINEADEAATNDIDEYVNAVPDQPPTYSSIQADDGAITEGGASAAENTEMGGATAPNESSGETSNRPYPLMLPNNYQVDQPIVVATTD